MPKSSSSRKTTPTVYSIAKACGVSGTTVSLALRDDPRLRPETRKRIVAYARKVGYRPNVAARHFKQGMTRSLGLVLPSATWWVDTLMLDLLARHAAQAGYDLQLQFSHDDLQQEARAVSRCLDGKVDGLFTVCSFESLDELPANYPLDELRRRGLPCVFLGGPVEDMPRVRRDRAKAVELATAHLVEQGYEHLYMLIAVRGRETFSYQDRASRFLKTMRKLSRPCDEQQVHYRTAGFERLGTAAAGDAVAGHAPMYFDYTLHHRYGYELARDVFETAPADKRIGLVCASDGLASGALRYCREHGLDVPGRVGVIGCDDTIANDLNLSTFAWDHEKLCATVMDLLTRQIQGKKVKPQLHLIEPTLVVRGTTVNLNTSVVS